MKFKDSRLEMVMIGQRGTARSVIMAGTHTDAVAVFIANIVSRLAWQFVALGV
jgi:hypothetical protein